jgi:hypothetical protein
MRVLFGKALWVWVIFFLLAVVNGFLREATYLPTWGELWGRVAGAAILLLAMLLVMYVFLRGNAALLTRPRLVLLGVLWLGLSLFFEFAVSHWVMEEPWERVLAHYNVLTGRLRVLVRLAELLGPIALGGRLLRARMSDPTDEALEPFDQAHPPTQAD